MANSRALPPPVGGWDTESALTDMPPENAVTLDNWFPDTSDVLMRPGYTEFASGMSGEVGTLLEYIPTTGTGQLFAVNDGKIYSITAGGAVGAAAVSGLSNSRFQQTQISTSAGHFLFAVNGADTPRTFDGSSWSTASITGPTAANLVWTNLHQRRLWFGESDDLSAWYLPVNSISGTASEFPMGALFSRGGYLMAMGTWTRDAGNGSDDVAVFITSEGQVALFQGVDPSSTSTWDLIGVFNIGKPIGRRCFIKAGADLIIITQDGFVACSSILLADRSQAELVAISKQINSAVNDAVRDFKSLFGWEPFLYPKGQMLIFNVPQSSSSAYQFTFNTITRKPCRFTGIDAATWALLDDNAYFGGFDGKVYKFDSGNSDDGANINADAVQAFNYFGSRTQDKSFKRAEPIFTSDGNPNPTIEMNTDFIVKDTTASKEAGAVSGAKWGSAMWGVDVWGSASQVYKGWRGIRGQGRAGSIRIRVSSNGAQPRWLSTNVIFSTGGMT